MRQLLKLTIFLTVFAICNNALAQTAFAKINKNKNVLAKDLYHDLNKTKDTLILRSDKLINALYTSNNNASDFRKTINKKEFKLPLKRLQKGKNVLVVVQSPLRIVFTVHVPEKVAFIDKSSDLKLNTKVVSINKE